MCQICDSIEVETSSMSLEQQMVLRALALRYSFVTISGVVPEARATRAYAQVRVAVEHILAAPLLIPTLKHKFYFRI